MVVVAANALDRLRHQDKMVLLQRLEDAVHHHHFVFQILLDMPGAAALQILGWPLASDMSAIVFSSPSSKYRCFTGERTLQ